MGELLRGDRGYGLGHDLCTLGCRDVMRLQHEAAQAARQKIPRELDVIRPPLDDIRSDVDLQVIATLDRLPCPFRDRWRFERDRRICSHWVHIWHIIIAVRRYQRKL